MKFITNTYIIFDTCKKTYNEFNNEKISSKISDFSSATGQDTNVAKINSFGWKTGDAKSDKF